MKILSPAFMKTSYAGAGEENESFKRKPSIIPMIATRITNLNENPALLLRSLRLFNMS